MIVYPKCVFIVKLNYINKFGCLSYFLKTFNSLKYFLNQLCVINIFKYEWLTIL